MRLLGLQSFTDRPPGQSIKTRVEANPVSNCLFARKVRLDNPLKQGLKLLEGHVLLVCVMSAWTIH